MDLMAYTKGVYKLYTVLTKLPINRYFKLFRTKGDYHS